MGFLYPYVYDTTYLWYNKKDVRLQREKKRLHKEKELDNIYLQFKYGF